ncbi:ArsB/NhaD family transporter [Acidothermaceae bacterium B102]|nr:ArsB/NhaD family transporter [Acidothermaceae bacterium B102]
MSSTWAEVVSVVLLLGALGFAVVRPRGLPEAVAAVPAAAVVLVIGAVSWGHARAETSQLWPVVAFLAVILVLAELCALFGVFTYAGSVMARRSGGSAQRLLVWVFVVASVVTAVLSLDATVVLLTPVVLLTASSVGARSKPQVYACAHLANTASLLLPVSNLTNLLAFSASGLSFLKFTELMLLPWLVAVGLEYAVFRRFFARDLAAAPESPSELQGADVPRFALVVVGLTLVGFVATSPLGIGPVWAALVGVVVLAYRALREGRVSVRKLVESANVPFVVFVLALGIVVRAVVDNGLGHTASDLLPSGNSLLALMGIALLAAVLANVVNNLPAVLVLVPIAASSGGSGPLLAVLLGVNLGPNLTYVGSLATLLWRRVLQAEGEEPAVGEFSRLGLVTVPVTIVGSVVALWAGLQVVG